MRIVVLVSALCLFVSNSAHPKGDDPYTSSKKEFGLLVQSHLFCPVPKEEITAAVENELRREGYRPVPPPENGFDDWKSGVPHPFFDFMLVVDVSCKNVAIKHNGELFDRTDGDAGLPRILLEEAV